MRPPSLSTPSRPSLVRLGVLALVLALLAPAGVSAVTHDPIELRPGTIDEPANGTTVIAVQGFKLQGQQSSKKPARLVGVGPEGNLEWRYSGTVAWFYDVDPLATGSLLVAGSSPGGATVFTWDPATRQRGWTEDLGTDDTHDADLINGDELLVADMRNYNGSADRNDDRIFVYNRTREEIVWEFRFERLYDEGDGGDYGDDWTHVNDVDKVGPGLYLASPRNMDQVVLINRSTKEVELRLGSDDDHSVLYEQHNPHYFEGPNGTPTLLVADSENDRVVEYARTNGTWERTWTLGTGGNLYWPRDADRLPNGNTLVTDSHNHRVIEVTPTGEVVWEYYAPWGTYEAERVALGDEPGGPTIREQNATGAYALNGSAALVPGAAERATFSEWLAATFADTPVSGEVEWLADRWAHATPWVRPVWMTPWAFAYAVGAALVVLGWSVGEVVVRRRRIWRRLRGLWPGSGATEEASATTEGTAATAETESVTTETADPPDGDETAEEAVPDEAADDD